MAKTKKAVEDYHGAPPETLDGHPFYGLELDKEQLRFANAIWNPNIDVVFCNSVSGTGKTTVSIGVANLLVKYGFYDGIIGVMSPVEDQRQGYLPGDITQKSEVYFEPFYQAMTTCNMNPNTDIITDSLVNAKYGDGFVKLITHTYTRGSSFRRQVVIIEEMENYTFREAKKILTRCSDDCKLICIGHDKQCDLNDPSTSGFVKYLEHFKPNSRCAVCELKTNHRGWISAWADALED